MVDIKPKDIKLMWVWNLGEEKKKAYVIGRINGHYIAIDQKEWEEWNYLDDSGEESEGLEYFNGYMRFRLYQYAEPIRALTGIVRSAESIVGVRGIETFQITTFKGIFNYTRSISELAGKKVLLERLYDDIYDYTDWFGNKYLITWLDNIKEEEI